MSLTDFQLAHLLEASQAVLSPHTTADVRQQASQYVEQAIQSPHTWEVFVEWLHQLTQQLDLSQSHNNLDATSTVMSMLLLYLQLLQTRIRRQLQNGPIANAPSLVSLHQQLTALAARQQHDKQLRSSVCIALAVLAVRCGETALTESIDNALSGHHHVPLLVSLQVLLNIPLEMELVRSNQAETSLMPHIKRVLEAIGLVLVQQQQNVQLVAPALEALCNWCRACHVNLSQLLQITIHQTSLLQLLIQILCQPQVMSAAVLVHASHALTQATMQTSDYGTEYHDVACRMIFAGIEKGFIRQPLTFATSQQWDEACLALAELACTLVTENIDGLVFQPAELLLRLLLELQIHPLVKVRMNMLEVWLTVQETPTRIRHEHWQGQLLRQVVQAIKQSIAYPQDFINWEESVEDDSEFDEYRRLCQDVLDSAYFVQRHEYVVEQVNIVLKGGASWNEQEAALYALTATARDVCVRVKAHGGGSSIIADRELTSKHLLLLVRSLCMHELAVSAATSQHLQLLIALVRFVGSYAPIWPLVSSSEESLQLLNFLEGAMRTGNPGFMAVTSAKAMRSVLISIDASTMLVSEQQDTVYTSLFELLQILMSTAAATDNAEAIVNVAEGCTRFVANSDNGRLIRQGLGQLAESLLNHVNVIVQELPFGINPAEYDRPVIDKLVSYCDALQVVIRFGDNGSGDSSTKSEMGEIVHLVLRFLESLAHLVTVEEVLKTTLSIHEQLLVNFPEIMATYLDQSVPYVYDIFERTLHPSALNCLMRAAEVYGSTRQDLFQQLLTHLSLFLFVRLDTQEKLAESALVLQAFFELAERYAIYCPASLLSSSQFPIIVTCAVGCLTALQGEREATRASLNFLNKLFGWRFLRLSPERQACFSKMSGQIDELLAKHGANMTQACMGILLGGLQILWPACSECLFTILHVASTWPVTVGGVEMSVAQQWMEQAGQFVAVNTPAYNHVASALLKLTDESYESKSRAKMLLTDFVKVHRGELGLEAFMSNQIGGAEHGRS